MKYKLIFLLLLGLDALNLIYQTSEISISYRESLILYGDFSILQTIVKISISIFGQNDFALRFPMILTHILSVILFFNISKHYIENDKDRLWLVLIFILLPGVLSSAIILDAAGLIIFGLLLFIWLYINKHKKSYYILLILFSFIDNSYLYLFLALSIFSIYIKDRVFFIFNIIIFIISILLFAIDAHGSPVGHFLDTLGLYAAIFSPVIFLYTVFVIYRRFLTKELDIIWFISSTVLLISLILSFRQSIKIEHFAPYLIIALPMVASNFISSYRVRLKQFRKGYKMMFIISLVSLLINTVIVLFNKELYKIIEHPRKHFVYKFHVAKELANELKSRSIDCVNADTQMQARLYFYGVTKCDKYKLTKQRIDTKNENSVTISYKKRPVYFANVTNIYK
ncbi:MAG: hypothetical protein L3I99_05075 [Sulfurimonas sp.]|nr:hypothetical protein [Sulfurimonas sp.]